MKRKPAKKHSLQRYHLCELQIIERQASIPAKYHCNSYSLLFLYTCIGHHKRQENSLDKPSF